MDQNIFTNHKQIFNLPSETPVFCLQELLKGLIKAFNPSISTFS